MLVKSAICFPSPQQQRACTALSLHSCACSTPAPGLLPVQCTMRLLPCWSSWSLVLFQSLSGPPHQTHPTSSASLYFPHPLWPLCDTSLCCLPFACQLLTVCPERTRGSCWWGMCVRGRIVRAVSWRCIWEPPKPHSKAIETDWYMTLLPQPSE